MKKTKDQMMVTPKIWGFELEICNSEKYCGKLLHIDEGHATSYHYHNIKDEHMYVTSGVLKIVHGFEEEVDGETSLVHEGEAFYIPVGLRHRLIAHEGPVEFFEFSTQHFDVDSIRVSPGF